MSKFDKKQTSVLSSTDLKTTKGKIIYWCMFGVLMIVAAISILPIFWTVMTAFKDTQEIYSEFTFFPKSLTFKGALSRIKETWEACNFTDSFVQTFILAIGNLVTKIVFCGLGGYVLSKLKPKGTGIIFTLIVWTMMMPGQIRMVPNYISWLHYPFATDIGIGYNAIGTYWPSWVGSIADCYTVLMFKNAFDGLSNSYVEAAKIDGCGNFKIFCKIMLPLAMPIVIYISIGIFTASWSDFMGPLLYMPQKSILPLMIYRLKFSAGLKMNTYLMALIFSIIPPYITFIFFQKRIMGGVNIGGVKG